MNENFLALKREFLFLHSTSEAAVEELVTEVMGEILRQVAGSVLSAERERVKEERRRVEEERRVAAFAVGQGGLYTPLGT